MMGSFVMNRFYTPAGEMIAVADEKELYLLEFLGRKNLDKELAQLKLMNKKPIETSSNAILSSIQNELKEYWMGKLKAFKTPFCLRGTAFQKKVWQALQTLNPGKTYSYRELATLVGNPKAYRAVANANGCNHLAIVIPCHRVIQANGKLGGYAGGLSKKQQLLDHEAKLDGI